MKELRWNLQKSEELEKTRGVSFKEIISEGKIVIVVDHPIRLNQKIILFLFKRYIWVVPFVEERDYYFLKTMYPSRKLTRIYREGKLK